jgi:hypothetical protein
MSTRTGAFEPDRTSTATCEPHGLSLASLSLDIGSGQLAHAGCQAACLGIPAKLNTIPEGSLTPFRPKVNTIGAKRRWLFDCPPSVQLGQEGSVRSAAEEGCR